MSLDLGKAIADAWLVAAEDLGIRIGSPYVLNENGQEYTYIALVHDFGGCQGILLCLKEQWKAYGDIAVRHGYSFSGLSTGYSRYDRARFVWALNDWGWFGATQKKPE